MKPSPVCALALVLGSIASAGCPLASDDSGGLPITAEGEDAAAAKDAAPSDTGTPGSDAAAAPADAALGADDSLVDALAPTGVADAAALDPPPVSANPCCDVGTSVPIDNPDSQASNPYVAWHGDGWAVTWEDDLTKRPTFRRLDRQGQPATALLPVPGLQVMPSALAFGGGRFGVLAGAAPFTPETRGELVILDGAGNVLTSKPLDEAGQGGALTRFPAVNGWAVATYKDLDGGNAGSSRLLLFDDALTRMPREIDLGHTLYADWRSIQMVALGDGLVIAQPTETGIRVRVFQGAGIAEQRPPGTLISTQDMLPAGASEPPTVVTAIGGTGLRGRFLLAAMDANRVRAWVYDPATGSVTGPTLVAASTGERTPGFAGDELGGSAGLCFPDGGDGTHDADTIRFAVLGPDGAPRGQPVTIASGLRYAAGCSVASGDRDQYLVTYWNAARDTPRPSIIATRVTVRRAP